MFEPLIFSAVELFSTVSVIVNSALLCFDTIHNPFAIYLKCLFCSQCMSCLVVRRLHRGVRCFCKEFAMQVVKIIAYALNRMMGRWRSRFISFHLPKTCFRSRRLIAPQLTKTSDRPTSYSSSSFYYFSVRSDINSVNLLDHRVVGYYVYDVSDVVRGG